MNEKELQELIMKYPLPPSVLARPTTAFFIVRSIVTAFLLFAALPFRPVRELFPRAGGKERKLSIERAAVSCSLTEALLRFPLFPFRRTCLRRSLLLSHLLRKCGIPVRVAFGVDPAEGGWEGHSWLVLNDRPFLEEGGESRSFVPVFYLPEQEGRLDGGGR